MDSGGQSPRPTTSSVARGSQYQNVDKALMSNLASSNSNNKAFGSSMPSGEEIHKTLGVNYYGNNYYSNPHLMGYGQASQNVISVDQLNNGVSPVDAATVEQMQRQMIAGQPQTNQQAMYYNQPVQQQNAYSNIPTQPTGDPNQMYMQPPVIPQISDMQTQTQPTYNGVNQQATQMTPVIHDLGTAEGSLDYLNSIAPTTTKGKTSNPISSKLFVAVGIGMIVLVAIVGVIGALGGSGNGNLSSYALQLGKDLANLQSIVTYGEDNSEYISTDLAGVTAETHLVIASHTANLGKVMALNVDEEGQATEPVADETSTEDLDKALAQGQLSKTYQQALQERLTNISDTVAAAYEATNDEEVKNALNNTYIDANELIARIKKAVPEGGGQLVD